VKNQAVIFFLLTTIPTKENKTKATPITNNTQFNVNGFKRKHHAIANNKTPIIIPVIPSAFFFAPEVIGLLFMVYFLLYCSLKVDSVSV
jgi:hypothetical protein